MATLTFLSAFVMVAVMLLTAPPSADAECCYFTSVINGGLQVCGDCTVATPYCGYSQCNIFGCNCGGGCRRGSCDRHKKRSVDEQTAKIIVSAGDLNGDGLLSIDEAETMLEQGPNAAHRRSVRSLDKNMDGMLSVDEIDY